MSSWFVPGAPSPLDVDGMTATSERGLVRELRDLIEPLHGAYLGGAGVPAYDAAGLKGGWMRYFAARSCPLGEASAELVEATFYGFHRRLITRSLPGAWRFASPARVHRARLEAVDTVIRTDHARVLGDGDGATAARLLAEAAAACEPIGRPLFAAHAALDPPDEQHLELWWAATMLREHRGDGHVAVLLADGIGACESLIWHCAFDGFPQDAMRDLRGWTVDEWSEAADRLAGRGWLDESGELTPAGREARVLAEDRTNDLALQPWRALGRGHLENAVAVLRRLLGQRG